MSEKTELENLLSRLGAATESFEQVESSTDELLDREAEVLTELVDRFGPIARFIGDRAEIEYSLPGGQFAHSTTQKDDESSIPVGAVLKTGDAEADIDHYIGRGRRISYRDSGDQNRGRYGGTVYRIGPNGLLKYSYDGHWSQWQGEACSFESSKSEASPAEVLEHFDLEDVLKALKKAMEGAVKENENKQKYLGKRQKTVEAVEKVLAL